MITAEDLKNRLAVDTVTTEVERCFEEASVIVADLVAQAFKPVPEVVSDGWTLEIGAELHSRTDGTGGSTYNQYTDGSGVPVRGPRDPLARTWPSIRRYVLPL